MLRKGVEAIKIKMMIVDQKMERIYEILESTMPQVDFERETNLVDDGVLDSLDVASLVSELNAEFDIEIPTEEVTPENLNSAKAIHELVERLMDED